MRKASPRLLGVLVPLLLAVSSCGGAADSGGGSPDEEQVVGSPVEEPQSLEPGLTTPGPGSDDPGDQTDQDGPSLTPGEDEPLTDESPPILGTPSPPAPGRALPADHAGHLRFWEVRVHNVDGTLTVHANLTNVSDEFLNGVEFSWRALNGGTVVDRDTGTWPSLAPGETVSVDLSGNVRFTNDVDHVDFELP